MYLSIYQSIYLSIYLSIYNSQITVSVFGFPEHIITEPMTPVEISDIIYNQCMEYEPIEAVLQQEV